MNSARIQLDLVPPIARLTLSHGKQNVIDFEMMDELSEWLRHIEAQPEVSVVVLTGAAENFSAGVDIPSHTPEQVAMMLEKFHHAVRALAEMQTVTVAAVRGNCLGGGAELAMMCDIVITTEDSRWGFPEIQLACLPPVACAALSVVVGQKRAAELILTGRMIDGSEAQRIGLANFAVAEDALEQTLAAQEQSFTLLSPVALRHAKRALYAWDAAHFEKGLAKAERIYLDDLMTTEDAQEGISAWMEKRKPQWKGQ